MEERKKENERRISNLKVGSGSITSGNHVSGQIELSELRKETIHFAS